jgi:hypothetical protein
MGIEELDLHPRLVRLPQVVGVTEADQSAARGGDPSVARGSESGMGASQRAYPVHALGDRGRLVGGAVVDDDDFDGGIVLREEALETLAEKVRTVVHGHDDRDEVGGHHADGATWWGGASRLL